MQSPSAFLVGTAAPSVVNGRNALPLSWRKRGGGPAWTASCRSAATVARRYPGLVGPATIFFSMGHQSCWGLNTESSPSPGQGRQARPSVRLTKTSPWGGGNHPVPWTLVGRLLCTLLIGGRVRGRRRENRSADRSLLLGSIARCRTGALASPISSRAERPLWSWAGSGLAAHPADRQGVHARRSTLSPFP